MKECDILSEFSSLFENSCKFKKDCSIYLKKQVLTSQCIEKISQNPNIYLSIGAECQSFV